MKKLVITILCTMSMVFFANAASALTITAMDSAENLAQTLLGSGVTISNVTYTGAAGASVSRWYSPSITMTGMPSTCSGKVTLVSGLAFVHRSRTWMRSTISSVSSPRSGA